MYVAGWYMYHGGEVEIGLGAESAIAFGQRTTFVGGQFAEDYDSYSIKVSTYSLERSSEALQQKRALELLQLVMQVGEAVPAMPHVRWDRLLEMVGDQMNMPALRDIISAPKASQQTAPPNAAGAGGVPIGSEGHRHPPVVGRHRLEDSWIPIRLEGTASEHEGR